MVGSIHRRAAAAELAAGDHPAAVRHLLAVGDHEAGVRLGLRPGLGPLPGRIDARAEQVARSVPARLRREATRGKIIRFATTLSLVGRLDDAATWNDRAAALVGNDEGDEFTFDLALSRALVHLGRGDTDDSAGGSAASRTGALATRRSPKIPMPGCPPSWPSRHWPTGRLPRQSEWIDAIGATRFRTRTDRCRRLSRATRRGWRTSGLARRRRATGRTQRCKGAGDRGRGARTRGGDASSRQRSPPSAWPSTTPSAWAESATELAASGRFADRDRCCTTNSPTRRCSRRSRLVRVPRWRLEACVAMTSAAAPDPLMRRYRLMTAELLARAGRWDHCERCARVNSHPHPAGSWSRPASHSAASSRQRHEACSRVRTRARGRCASRSRQQCCCIGPSLAIRRHLRRAVDLGATNGFVWTFIREGPALRDELRRVVDADSQWRSTPLAAALHASDHDPGTGTARTHRAALGPRTARCWSCCQLTSRRSNWPDGSTSRPTRSAPTSRRSTESSG